MRQVALNLLSNAIKFTPQGGAIEIKVGWTRSGGQYLSIRDTGPGIPPEEIPIVLSSFGRGSLAHKNAEEGTGLGLPIVKGLVELHGGQFRLISKLRAGNGSDRDLPAGAGDGRAARARSGAHARSPRAAPAADASPPRQPCARGLSRARRRGAIAEGASPPPASKPRLRNSAAGEGARPRKPR